ncbi:hypothetical protein K438DRAFT_1850890 [Mycena galopus ATCC 62051]|nr:hypothetical protein K438DRAFT_1850890 [Mycena galopus ATCC 62051]
MQAVNNESDIRPPLQHLRIHGSAISSIPRSLTWRLLFFAPSTAQTKTTGTAAPQSAPSPASTRSPNGARGNPTLTTSASISLWTSWTAWTSNASRNTR